MVYIALHTEHSISHLKPSSKLKSARNVASAVGTIPKAGRRFAELKAELLAHQQCTSLPVPQ